MITFLTELKGRNETLFYFSAILFGLAILFLSLTKLSTLQVAGVNAWYKPFKFAISIAIYCSTMAWYCYYLPSFDSKLFNWSTILLFGFEIAYITFQAGRAQESHFNLTTPLYQTLFAGMAFAAISITLYTAYVAIRFFQTDFPNLPTYYVWAIRLSLVIFIVFSFEGLAMGGRQTHTIGTQIQNTFLPLFKWNMKEGDLRIAHFIGMHALQLLPILAFYLLKNTKAVFVLSSVYALLAIFTLIQALQGKPLFKLKKHIQNETIR